MLPNFQFSIFNFQKIKLGFVFVFFLSLISYFLFLPSAHAATNISPDVPNNPHFSTQSTVIEIMSAITCQLSGVDPINPKQSCLGVDQLTGKIGFLPSTKTGGAIGFMGNMISALYTPPLHTADYFQNLAQNFGIAKKTYAQQTGTGFQSLTSLLNVWSALRNIVYLILVIVFVVIGLAIMLRVKIDPRTVMTIQNQIPKIIVGILAVTFSFAIAGFLIDMMWVLIYLTYGIFNGIKGVDVQALNPAVIQGQNALQVAGSMGGIFGITHDSANSVKDTLQNILGIKATWTEIFNPFAVFTNFFDPSKRGNFINWAIDAASYGAGIFTLKNYEDMLLKTAEIGASAVGWVPFIGGSLKEAASAILGATGAGVATGMGYATFVGTETFLRIGLPYVIVYLIILISVVVALFRLWFALIMAYVQILLDVVLAPFWIIGGIIPGSPISLTGWLKSMAANLLAFPATLALFMLGKVFMDIFSKPPPAGTQNFVPPLIGDAVNPSLIGSLIGLGILLMTPNILTMLKAALKVPKTEMGLGKAIGGGVGIVMSTAKGAIGLHEASKEIIITGQDKQGSPTYGTRGQARSFWSRFSR